MNRLRVVLPIFAILVVPLLAATAAFAGPNEGGTLIVHANPSLSYTTDHGFCGESGLTHCSMTQDSLPYEPGIPRVWFILASFGPSAQPRLKATSFGVAYDSTRLVVLASGTCADFEIPGNRWPAPGTGTGQSWTECRTGELAECYWFAGYTYGEPGSPDTTSFAVVPHPRHGAVFVDDSMPPLEDTVLDFGRLGFGHSGFTVCYRMDSPSGPDDPEPGPLGGDFPFPTEEEQGSFEPGKYWYQGHEVSVTWDQLASAESFEQLWETRSGADEDTLFFGGYPYRTFPNVRYVHPLAGMSEVDRQRFHLLEQAADSVRSETDPEVQARRYVEVLERLDPEHALIQSVACAGDRVGIKLPRGIDLFYEFEGDVAHLPNFAPRQLPLPPRDLPGVKLEVRQLLANRGWLLQQAVGATTYIPTGLAIRLQDLVSSLRAGQHLDDLVDCASPPPKDECFRSVRRFLAQVDSLSSR